MVTLSQKAGAEELLSTKLAIPRLGSLRVQRRSLLARLDSGLLSDGFAQKLTLLSAPAGFGKTTLVVEWIDNVRTLERSNVKTLFAWLSLDSCDNDPVRFWRYVFTAVQAFDVEAGNAALALLDASRGRSMSVQPDFEAALTALINKMAQRSGRNVLVLEDYHAITNTQIHEAVAFLLDHLPPGLHLVLLTRSDPPLPLARLRARNELNELRALDLRFSEAETHEFLMNELARPGIQTGALLPDDTEQPSLYFLSPQVSARLTERTEGWAAGLRLVALALQDRQGPGELDEFLDTFTGSHRPVLEYLVADVLASQGEPVQVFLLETSFLSRLTGSLCDAVRCGGRKSKDEALYPTLRPSTEILEYLEKANLFITPLGGAGQWYRFHPLFAEAMQYAARQRLGELHLRELAHNASRWFEEHDLLSEAVETAFTARAFERAACLIERVVEPRLAGNEFHTLLRWMQGLPDEVLRAHPALSMTYAQAILFTSGLGPAVPVVRLQAPLEMAEQAWAAAGNEPKLGEVLAFRALVAVRQGDYPRSFELARQALARLPEGGSQESSSLESRSLESLREWRGISLIFSGWEAYYAGRMNAAHQSLAEARDLLQSAGNIYGLLDATLGLGEVHARRAEPGQAAGLFQQALLELEQAPIDRKDELRRRGRALLGLAVLAYERNDLEAARQGADQAVAIGEEAGVEDLLAHGEWILARLQRARGEIEPAWGRLNALLARIKQPLLLRTVQAWQALLAISTGDLVSVGRWSAAYDLPPDSVPALNQEQEALILARVKIKQGEAEAALHQLERWLADARSQGRARSELEILNLIAQAEAALGRLPQARQALFQALSLAEPKSFVRVFLDEGETVRLMIADCRLMIEERARTPLIAYVDSLLVAFSGNPSTPGLERVTAGKNSINNQQSKIQNSIASLSQQEERVLRLLAAGLTNPEIAQELVVSVNTVKTHVKSIYRKLSVSSRRSAREAARGLKLIS